jgi:hypothetical protein
VKKSIAISLIGITFAVILGVISYRFVYKKPHTSSVWKHIDWTQENNSNGTKVTFSKYIGKDTWTFKAKKGDKIGINYNFKISTGAISMFIEDSYKNQLVSIYTENQSKGLKEFVARTSGIYKIITKGDNAKGMFNFYIR